MNVATTGPVTHLLALRVEGSDERVLTVSISVSSTGDGDDVIAVDDRVIGFVHRAGQVFVALSGSRIDRAEECGQALLWDLAVAGLISSADVLPKPARERGWATTVERRERDSTRRTPR